LHSYRVVKLPMPLTRLILALVMAFGGSASVGATAGPTPVPSGLVGRIAYGTDEGIWAMEADGSHRRQLTTSGEGESDYDPVWSPDGTRIAFRATRAAPGDADGIMVVHVDGSGEYVLAPGAHPTWSPDGGTIAFSGLGGLFAIAPDGTGLRRLTDDDGQYPDWSPDGKRIAYMAAPAGSHEIFVMNVDGSDRINVTNNNVSDAVPDWSPDGRQIVFFSERDGNEEIYVMNADGSGVERVTQTRTNEEFPVWTPDGRIAFNDDRDGDGDVEWYLINPDGTGERELRQLTEAKATNFIDWTAEPSATPGATPAAETAAPSAFFAGRVVYHDETRDLWAMNFGLRENAWLTRLARVSPILPTEVRMPE
jgi:Tol biopolymer transport system component